MFRKYGYVLILLGFFGCSTASRQPGPSDSGPQEAKSDRVSQNNRQKTTTIDSQTNEDQAATHFSLGQAYSYEGETDKAIEEYKLALVYDPKSAVIRTRLASEYVKRGLLTFAIQECKTALEIDPKHVDARLLLAGLYASTKLISEALKNYDEVLKLDPSNNEAYVFKGSLLLEEGREKEAADVLNKLVKKDPEYPLGFYYLARVYQKMEKYEKAIENYEKALDIRPSFSQAGLSLGLLYEELRKTDKAISAYIRTYESSGEIQAVARLSQLYIEKEEFEKALKYLLVLEQGDPENLNVKVKIGLIYVERQWFDKAEKQFKDILQKTPDSDRVRYYLASVLEEQKKFDEAINEFRAVPQDSTLWIDSALHVALIYKLQGSDSKSMEWTDRLIEQNPKVAQFYLFKASLLEDQKLLAEAAATLETVRTTFGSDEKILYYLGSLYDRIGKTEDALSCMQAILDVNPENAHALNYVGYTYLSRKEHLADAGRLIKKAVKLLPNDPYIRDSYGYYLLVMGKTKAAIIAFEQAYKLKADELIIVQHLGDAYLKLNLKQKALQKYIEAVSLNPDAQETTNLQKKIKGLQKALGLKPTVTDEDSQRMPADTEESTNEE
ncbi:MAG: tetratricopeptide repeat protein [Bacteriovoracia bacterium]